MINSILSFSEDKKYGGIPTIMIKWLENKIKSPILSQCQIVVVSLMLAMKITIIHI